MTVLGFIAFRSQATIVWPKRFIAASSLMSSPSGRM